METTVDNMRRMAELFRLHGVSRSGWAAGVETLADVLEAEGERTITNDTLLAMCLLDKAFSR